MKRFWDTAEAAADEAGWSVLVDGKPVRVPGGCRLTLPSPGLAQAVAEEWRNAGGGKGHEISYQDLPLTRIAGTAQERIGPDPAPTALAIARYAESDLLCYRATRPDALACREAEAWDPWLDWAWQRYGARLRVGSGVVHVPQASEALAGLAAAVAAQAVPVLAGLGIVVPALGSLVLGLAVAERMLDAETAYALSVVDAEFQAEQWGIDAEAQASAAAVRADVTVAARFMALSRS